MRYALPTLLLAASSLFGADVARAQLLDPQIKDNAQPTIGLTYFLDAQGFVRMTAANFVPNGYATLSGGLIPASTSPTYTNSVGTTWGGDGATTVGVPDAIGRTIIGASAGAPVGTVQGSSTMTITSANFPASQGGAAQPINNLQPAITMRYAIRTEGFYPDRFDRPAGGIGAIGAVAAFAGTTLPPGWEYAEGQVISIQTNQALFSLLGTTFGGNGQTTFQLPDLRGRVPIGADPSIRPLGTASGVSSVTLTDLNVPTVLGGGGAAFTNMQPTLALNFQVQPQGIFPAFPNSSVNCPCATSEPFEPFLGEVNMYAMDLGTIAAGQLQAINQNQALFALLGTTYGGNGQTTFALPDLRGRVVAGAGISPVDGSRSLTIGATYGVESHLLSGTAPVPVPEPAAPALLAVGLGALLWSARRRQRVA